jgi:hypothetical protein
VTDESPREWRAAGRRWRLPAALSVDEVSTAQRRNCTGSRLKYNTAHKNRGFKKYCCLYTNEKIR